MAAENGYVPNFSLTSEIIEGAQKARPSSSSTDYLTNPAYPALFIKASRPGFSRKDADIQTLRNEFRSYQDLEVPDLHVVPFSVVQHAGELAVIAHKVEGVPLTDELPKNPDVVAQYDQIFARQLAKLAGLRGQDQIYPSDAYGPQQFMWGTLWGTHEKPGIIFVDIEADSGLMYSLKDLASDDRYFDDLVNTSFSLIQTKNDLGIELPATRSKLILEIETIKQSVPHREIETLLEAIDSYDTSSIDNW